MTCPGLLCDVAKRVRMRADAARAFSPLPCLLTTLATRLLRRKTERVAQIPELPPHARQRRQSKTPRQELQDRRRVVRRVIDKPALGERRNDDRRDPCSGSPAVALRRRHVIPEAAVL